VIGLIGGIGGGKSRVAAVLAEEGAFVIDADAVGHALLDQRPVRELVVERFGERVLASPGAGAGEADTDNVTDADRVTDTHTSAPPSRSMLRIRPVAAVPPSIDRRVLGAIVFNQPAALRQLEAILHPRMRRTFERAIARTIRRGQARAVVLDAAILLEAGWDTLCDRIVFVEAPRDQRLARLSAARGWTEEMLEARESAQWPLDRKRALADAVVVNDAGPESLQERVRRLAGSLLPPARPPGANQVGSRVSPGPGRGRGADASKRR
jgi:dephospho-CoA kinase